LWENGTVSVATEHLATNYLRHRLLMWMLSGRTPQSKPIVLACAPNEWHEAVCSSWERFSGAGDGWYLIGQSVPLSDLANFVRGQPSMIVSVAMIEQSAQELARWPEWMPEISQNNSRSSVMVEGFLWKIQNGA
jgi:hypothetical protein